MPRPVFGRSSAAQAAARVTPLDRDRPLVAAARRDPARFDALYRKYLAQVYSFAFYELGDHHSAEDATERTFLHVLGALPRFDERGDPGSGGSTFRVWLFRIAHNVIANERRSVARHRAAPLDDVAPPPDPIDLAGRVERRDDADRAWAAVARLPAERRRAIVLRFVEEMSTREIAGILGRSEGAVRVLLHRAIRSVARDLGEGS
jgi:RNA polymerase sigma-70 factor (ECF subfamily)